MKVDTTQAISACGLSTVASNFRLAHGVVKQLFVKEGPLDSPSFNIRLIDHINSRAQWIYDYIPLEERGWRGSATTSSNLPTMHLDTIRECKQLLVHLDAQALGLCSDKCVQDQASRRLCPQGSTITYEPVLLGMLAASSVARFLRRLASGLDFFQRALPRRGVCTRTSVEAQCGAAPVRARKAKQAREASGDCIRVRPNLRKEWRKHDLRPRVWS